MYSTNAIESLHATLRKSLKVRGHFPNADAASKLLHLALRHATPRFHPPYTGATPCATYDCSTGIGSPQMPDHRPIHRQGDTPRDEVPIDPNQVSIRPELNFNRPQTDFRQPK